MEHLINLNFAPGGLPATVHVSQYDDTIRQLRFQLWFGRSKVEVPSGASVRVDIKKPDGHIVLVNGTVNSSDRSIVTVPTTKQMTAVPGGSRGTLVVSSTGDKRISSAIFILQVHRDPVEDGDASDSDLSMLQDAIDQTAANATAAQAAATAAQQAAESFTVDSALDSTSTNAIQNKAVAAGFAAINESLDAIVPGLTDTAKSALMACFKNVAWKDATVGETMYNALAVALDYSEDALPSGYTEKGYIYRTQAESDWTNGLSKLLKTPSYTNVTDLTFEYDVMPITATSGNKMIVAANDYSKMGGSPSWRGGVIFYIDTSRKRISVFSHATAIGVNDISTVEAGKKTHVKLVPGTESPAKLYLNGSLAAEGAWTSTEKGTARIGLNTYIGNDGADRTKASDNVAVGILSLYDSNNNPVARYVPCVRNADNVIGWYDTVSRTFITTDTVSYATIGHQNCIYAVGDWEE